MSARDPDTQARMNDLRMRMRTLKPRLDKLHSTDVRSCRLVALMIALLHTPEEELEAGTIQVAELLERLPP